MQGIHCTHDDILCIDMEKRLTIILGTCINLELPRSVVNISSMDNLCVYDWYHFKMPIMLIVLEIFQNVVSRYEQFNLRMK